MGNYKAIFSSRTQPRWQELLIICRAVSLKPTVRSSGTNNGNYKHFITILTLFSFPQLLNLAYVPRLQVVAIIILTTAATIRVCVVVSASNNTQKQSKLIQLLRLYES